MNFMRSISAPITHLLKYVWILPLVLASQPLLFGIAFGLDLKMMFIAGILLTVSAVLFFLFRNLPVVSFDGETFQIENAGKKELVAISDIESITGHRIAGKYIADRLNFRRDTTFGRHVTFFPGIEFSTQREAIKQRL